VYKTILLGKGKHRITVMRFVLLTTAVSSSCLWID